MNTRPARRKSTLTGDHPVAPEPAQGEPDAPEPKTTPPRKSDKSKFSFYVRNDLLGRLRAATPDAMVERRVTNMSAWMEQVLEEEVRRLEAQYNDGQEYPQAEAGTVTRPGRPMENRY